MSDDALLQRIRLNGAIPTHVAVIMDGNGRWAQGRSLPRPLGHAAGMGAVREAVEACLATGVEVLTLFAFSQENWQRPADEIAALMNLLEEYIQKEMSDLRERRVAVRFLGELDRLVPSAREAVERIVATTAGGDALALNICVSYGSRAEITRAARLLAEDVASGRIKPEQVDEEALARRLYTAGWPDPDLLIRTSGEQRISNYLLWQAAYSELHFTDVLWPDFSRADLETALDAYAARTRRFGGR